MIANKTLKLSLKSLREFARKRLPDQELIDLDARDECPLEIVRHMCSPDKLGIHGPHRSGDRHGRAGHFSWQRSHHGRRHA
jgi:hypothetical protein